MLILLRLRHIFHRIRAAKSPKYHIANWLATPQAAVALGEIYFKLLGRRRKGGDIDLSQIKRVLVVRLDEIGDVVMSTSLLRELRRNLPEAWITLIVKPAVYNFVELCPYLNEVVTFDCNTDEQPRELRLHVRALKLAWDRLWKRRFDLAIVPRWDFDGYHASFLAYFSGARWRVGYSEDVTECKKRSNKGYDRLFTHALHDNTLKHEVEHNLGILGSLKGTIGEDRLEVWTDDKEETFVEQLLDSYYVGADELIIAFCPGAGTAKRMWPVVNFSELGKWLKKNYKARILVLGSDRETRLGIELQDKLGDAALNVVGQTTIRQVAALLRRCHLFIGNDSGLMHLAASVGLPIVEISCHPLGGSLLHANSEKRFGPWTVSYSLAQPVDALAPCSDSCSAEQAHCILGVTVDQVKVAVMEQLTANILRDRDIRK